MGESKTGPEGIDLSGPVNCIKSLGPAGLRPSA